MPEIIELLANTLQLFGYIIEFVFTNTIVKALVVSWAVGAWLFIWMSPGLLLWYWYRKTVKGDGGIK